MHNCILIGWAAFQIYANISGTIGSVNLRIFHLLFLIPLAIITHSKISKARKPTRNAINSLLVIASVLSLIYIMNRYPIVAKTGRLITEDILIGTVCIITVFESARRACKSLAVIAFLFFSYFAFWGRFVPGAFGTASFGIKQIIKPLVFDTIGIFGTGCGVSSTYIFTFVLFGSFLKYSGFSQLINDLSLTLVGRKPGGPAKVAVIASAMMGMINGSAIANVATTGTITIPLMKKTGYKKEFAGAVEAVASTGGQFTPPIMGAVGFVMAEFMSVSYTKVMLAAIIPALLYYIGLLWSVHIEAKRVGLSGLSAENIPNAKQIMSERGHMVIPLIILLALMFSGFTPLFAAIIAMFAIIPISYIKKETRMNPQTILKAIIEGSKSAIDVGISCAVIGIIIGSVNMTGLGVNFGNLILSIAGEGQLILGGILVMVMSIILGMGVPGVAAYVIVYAVAVPVLRKLGASAMSANMFCLIYACLSNITPPVAMSSYVASGIAKSNMAKTSLIAIRLGITGFIVPFFFLTNPVLLLGTEVMIWKTVYAFVTACIGVIALSTGLADIKIKNVLLIISGILLINPNVMTDIIAIILIAIWVLIKGEKA